jgi:hypothetical protein
MAGRIRVLSERMMARGFEGAAGRMMENVQQRVLSAPGLIKRETLKDVNDSTRYVVLSEVQMVRMSYHVELHASALPAVRVCKQCRGLQRASHLSRARH